MMGGSNIQEINFVANDQASSVINNMSTSLDAYKKKKQEVSALDQKSTATLEEYNAVSQVSFRQNKMAMMQFQQLNMSILGMNMSLLGVIWSMKTAGIVSQETAKKIGQVLGPLQLVASILNFTMSMWQAYTLVSQLASVRYTMVGGRMVATNTALIISFKGLQISILGCYAALGALGMFAMIFVAKGWQTKTMLAALSVAMALYALRSFAAAAGNAVLLAFTGQWVKLAIGAALAVAALALIAGLVSATPGLWMGGIANRKSSITVGEMGPEAVVYPMTTYSGRKMMRESSNGMGNVSINNLYITANNPNQFYKGMNRAIKHMSYVKT